MDKQTILELLSLICAIMILFNTIFIYSSNKRRTKKIIRFILLRFCCDKNDVIDLADLNLEGKKILLHNLRAKEIYNEFQKAEEIHNGFQTAKIILNNNQEAEKIKNNSQNYNKVIT